MQEQTLEQIKIQLQANARDIEEREALRALSERSKVPVNVLEQAKKITARSNLPPEELQKVRSANAAKGRERLAKLKRKAKRLGYTKYTAGMDLSKPAQQTEQEIIKPQTAPENTIMTGITGKQYAPLKMMSEDTADNLLEGLKLLLTPEQYEGFIRGAAILGFVKGEL